MQESGGLLLAAGLDGGDSSVFLSAGKKNANDWRPQALCKRATDRREALSESQSLPEYSE